MIRAKNRSVPNFEEATMKTASGILVAAALAGSVACSTLKTSADYDRSANFSQYRTFAIRDAEAIGNEILERRIKSTLASGLAARGLTENADAPDLWAVPHVRLSQETQISTYNSGWGYGWHWAGGGMSTTTVEQIPVGTLIVDLVDAKRKELVWRGTATDTLKPEATAAEREAALSAAITKMLEVFPPK
jgi:Domain of unknown function (DUF4136)